jgi:hypothetical protein
LTFHTLLIDLIFERKRSKRRHRLLLFSSHRLLSFSFFLRAIKRKIKEKDGEESRRGIRLPVQGSINRRLRSREIEPPLPIYSQRVLFGVQVHHWRRIRYSHSSSYYYLTLSLSLYLLTATLCLIYFNSECFATGLIFICNSQLSLVRSR